MGVLNNDLRNYLDEFKRIMQNKQLPTNTYTNQTSEVNDAHLFCSTMVMAVKEYKDKNALQKKEKVDEITREIFDLLVEKFDLKDEVKESLKDHLYEKSDRVDNFFNCLKKKFKALSSAEGKQLLPSGSSWTSDMLFNLFDCLLLSKQNEMNIKYQSVFLNMNENLNLLPIFWVTKCPEIL